MEPKDNIHELYEWAIWVKLDSSKNLELILLKGHLILEIILNDVLQKHEEDYKNYSFYRKIIIFEKISFKNKTHANFIINSLIEINSLRNKIAHELFFKVKDGDLELWSKKILDNLKGEKHSKYTYRTKIVHSFSILAKNILDLR